GADLELVGDVLRVLPRSDFDLRYLCDNAAVIARLASEFYERTITIDIAPAGSNSDPEAPDSSPDADEPSAEGDTPSREDEEQQEKLHARYKKVDYALAYARHGIRVFPCHEVEADGFCSCGAMACGNPAKHPRYKGWQADATADEKVIGDW